MREVIHQLHHILEGGHAVSYCRLVETRGSTPQKAGALMLVLPDGSQVGTLGGGCVEAEVKRRALSTMERGRPEIATFQLDSDYGWDDGLICGGRMQILIEPLDPASRPEYLRSLGQLIDRGAGLTEALVFDERKASLPTASAYLFDQDGQLVDSLRGHTSGGNAPDVVVQHLRTLDSRPRPYAANGISFLPMMPRCRLLIVGGGHVGKAVAELAAELDFDIWVVDDRADVVSQDRFPRAERRISGDMDTVLSEIEITPDTYCLIVTRGHNHDEKALYHLAQRGARYVGLIGSRRKIKMIFDDLLSEGISAESLERVHAPVGLDIGSQSVMEIAVSIAAELVSHRNRAGVVPGRPAGVTVNA